MPRATRDPEAPDWQAPPPSRRKGPAERAAQAVLASHREGDAGELYGIAELCQAFSITPRTLRFYEAKGLLEPRRVNGTRVYSRRDRARLALILRSKAIGASLGEIQHYLDLYGDHGEGRDKQLRYVLERTDATIRDLEEKRAHIEATLAELRLINAEVRKRLDPA
ncbi:MAG: MerR family DNA-binding transcriptional regulator [Rubrivivax sp.]|nr:MerR family DNA-binding transcriptional regulator [Rubrivivax sp.]